ncbi:MAG: alpha/beta hydrolase [Bacteroidetes bacterium]|nr:alpha/beta hydrolase [Bacteroidota bacterium]
MKKIFLFAQLIILIFYFTSCNVLKYPGNNQHQGNNGSNGQSQNPPPQQPQINEVPHAVAYDLKNATLSASPMYGEKIIYSTSEIKRSTGTFGSNTTFSGSKMDLQYFFTAPNEKTPAKKPFVLLIHGGGFIAGGYKSSMQPAMLFAQRGYAAASIDYRLGWNTGGSNPGSCKGDTISMYKAVYRATQDARAALRYFVANADQFGIDTSQIFIWGSSAGNITASAVTFMTQQDFDAKIPGVENSLGSLNTASNNLRNDFHIKALLTVTGFGMVSKSYINSQNAVPVFFMVRANDPVLPYGHEQAFKCKNYFYLYGASEMKNVVKSYNMPYTLYTESGSGHKVGYSNDFVVSSMCNFIKSLWAGDYRFLEYSDYTNKLNSKVAE